ncbi:MAG: hypothetical protein V4628_16425 [Pseudomonadota bacterium]
MKNSTSIIDSNIPITTTRRALNHASKTAITLLGTLVFAMISVAACWAVLQLVNDLLLAKDSYMSFLLVLCVMCILSVVATAAAVIACAVFYDGVTTLYKEATKAAASHSSKNVASEGLVIDQA